MAVAAVARLRLLFLVELCEGIVVRCWSKQSNSRSLCCPRAFSACWVELLSTQYLISIACLFLGSLIGWPLGTTFLCFLLA